MSDAVHKYIDWSYSPSFPIDDMIEGAIINNNIYMLKDLIHVYKGDVTPLIYEYHMWDKKALSSLLSVVEKV